MDLSFRKTVVLTPDNKEQAVSVMPYLPVTQFAGCLIDADGNQSLLTTAPVNIEFVNIGLAQAETAGMFSLGNGEPSFKVLTNMLGEDVIIKTDFDIPVGSRIEVTIYQVR
ncbi:hypothetical protein ValSw41_72 [Vibrio phage ValSw4_1]|nr:hypothetical protein ValSw41_72 [Vibrio phage ValSw4_1]